MSQRPHRHRQCGRGRVTPSPDNADLESVWSGAVHDHLVDEAAEEGLLLLRRQPALTPQLRELLAGLQKGRAFLGAEDLGRSRLLLFALAFLFGVLEVP